MPNVTGSFSGRAMSNTMAPVGDMPNHTVALTITSGMQKSSDPRWDGCQITYCDTSDLNHGSGPHQGYFVNLHPNGDRDFGTFEGRVRTDNGQVTLEGAWRYSGGTGEFEGITGSGTYKARMTSPTEVVNDWEGHYELAARAASARPQQAAGSRLAPAV